MSKPKLYRSMLETAAAEHAARMMAMEAATSNANDMINTLTLYMNRVRQASITKEIIEVVSGARPRRSKRQVPGFRFRLPALRQRAAIRRRIGVIKLWQHRQQQQSSARWCRWPGRRSTANFPRVRFPEVHTAIRITSEGFDVPQPYRYHLRGAAAYRARAACAASR